MNDATLLTDRARPAVRLERHLPDPDDVVRGLDAVTSDDVARVASELIATDRLRLAVIGPFDDASRFEGLLDG